MDNLALEKPPEGVKEKKGTEVRKWPLYGLAAGSLGLIAMILIFKPEWARAEEKPPWEKPPEEVPEKEIPPEEVPPEELPKIPPKELPEVPLPPKEVLPKELPEVPLPPKEVPPERPPEAVGRPKIRLNWSRYYVG